jgi:sugar phosphate isomerase/epimerase
MFAHIDAAADSGYTTISVSPEQYAGAKRSPAELRSRLDDVGISVDVVDPTLAWLPGLQGSASGGLLSYQPADLLEAAAALGAPWINAAAALPGPWSEAEITEAFAVLCASGAEVGIGVLLEFVPWSTVGDLASAARVVRASGATNAGVTFDVWHFHRGGGRIANLSEADLALVHCIQLNDATSKPTTDPMTESISARLLPGDGEIPLPALLQCVLAHAATDVLSLEVFSTDLARRPALETAKLAAAAAHRVLGEME